MKKYELWLDETGDFSAKEQIEGSKKDKVYSLIGGVLMPMGGISTADAWNLVGNEVGHATELGKEETGNDLVPALKNLKEKDAQFVFFENRKRFTKDNKIDLYMEMMVDGIMQLISFLAVFDKEFQLDIMIAVRYVEEEENVLTKIPYQKYSDDLKAMLMERVHYGFMELDEDIKINVLFASARQEPKLMLADYACGARRATLRLYDNRYSKEDKAALKEMFDENYIFDSYEASIMGRVKNKLIQNCLAEAILVLCNDKKLRKDLPDSYLEEYGDRLHNKMKWLITEKMSQLGKLEIRSQLEELLADINAGIQLEDEYEWGETFLHTLEDDFLDELKKYEIHDDRLDLAIAFAYADLYLKEGDLKSLEKALDRAEESFERLPQSLDFLWSQFRIWTLRQACCLHAGDFEGAKEWEDWVRNRSDELEEVLILAGIWEEGKTVPNRFQKETMRLRELRNYMELIHGQADDETAQTELEEGIERVDLASMEEIRIFPRGCFYYLIHTGRIGKALSWLADFTGAVSIGDGTTDVKEIQRAAKDICRFLVEMDGRQKNELLREYLYLLKKTKEQELNGITSHNYSDILYQELEKSSILQIISKDNKDQIEIKSHLNIDNKAQYRHLVRSVLKDYQDKIYHPTEQIWWLYASYLNLAGKDGDKMNQYYNKAVQLCEQSEEYLLMQKCLLAIQAERTGRKLISGNKKSLSELNKLKILYSRILELPAMTDGVRNYLENEWKIVWHMEESGIDAEVIGNELLILADKMCI